METFLVVAINQHLLRYAEASWFIIRPVIRPILSIFIFCTRANVQVIVLRDVDGHIKSFFYKLGTGPFEDAFSRNDF